MEGGQVFLSQEVGSKPTTQSKSCQDQKEVQGPGSQHDCSRSEGVAMPPFLSSSVAATEALSRPVFHMTLKKMREVSLFSSSSSLLVAQSSIPKRYFQFRTEVRTQALHPDGPGFES